MPEKFTRARKRVAEQHERDRAARLAGAGREQAGAQSEPAPRAPRRERPQAQATAPPPPSHSTPIQALGLAPYVVNRLADDGIATIADLTDKSRSYLLRLPGIGAHAAREVQARLAQLGLQMEPDPPAPPVTGHAHPWVMVTQRATTPPPVTRRATTRPPIEQPPPVTEQPPLLLNRADLKQYYGIRYSRSYLTKLIARGLFPAPVSLGPYAYSRKAWRRDRIDRYIEQLTEVEYAAR